MICCAATIRWIRRKRTRSSCVVDRAPGREAGVVAIPAQVPDQHGLEFSGIAVDLWSFHKPGPSILDENPDWQSQVVTDGDWTAVNVVPTSIDLDQLPQEVLASDRLYQSIRPALTQDGSCTRYRALRCPIDI